MCVFETGIANSRFKVENSRLELPELPVRIEILIVEISKIFR